MNINDLFSFNRAQNGPETVTDELPLRSGGFLQWEVDAVFGGTASIFCCCGNCRN